MSRADEKNIKALHEGFNKLYQDNLEMQQKIVRLENAVAILNTDLANNKQMTAHIFGRGMGPTVIE